MIRPRRGNFHSDLIWVSSQVVVVVVISSSHQSPCIGFSLLRSALSIAILLSVLSATKGSRKGGGCEEANDRSCGNGCVLLSLFYSCIDLGFGCDRRAVVQA